MNSRIFRCAALLALLSTCFKPQSQDCGGGLICPDGFACSRDGRSCVVASDQCGNGRIDIGEICDDGNTADNDGCARDCKSDESCGNHVIDVQTGEVCDDGNHVDGDTCSAD